VGSQPPERRGVTEPRVFTPPLRELTPETSLGFAVIDFARDILGIRLYPWQEWLLIHALELLPNGLFRFRTVVVLVARQNGKSTVGQVLALFFMFVLQVRLVLGTAQNLDISSDLWRDTLEIAQEIPELAAEIKHVTRQMSRERFETYNGNRYQVAAASRRGGRGKSGDLVLMDELREHQTWQAWSAITKTTMARAKALVWCMSNAGDSTSVVLRHLRKQAHARAGDPDKLNSDTETINLQALLGEDYTEDMAEMMQLQADATGIFEWSAAPGRDKWDRDGWAEANPSMGYGELSERNIAAACATDPEWEFRTEVLCQWFDGALNGPFSEGKWARGIVTDQPPAGTPFKLGIDMSADRRNTHIVAAYHRPDGVVQVSLEASRPGSEWVSHWLSERATAERPLHVGLQGRSAPVSSLADELDALEHVHVERWGGADLGNATATFFDLVEASAMDDDGTRHGLCHLPAPALEVAAATAVTRTLDGGGMVWDRIRSPEDAAPIIAATVAVWLLTRPAPPPQRSAYDSGASLTLLD
jgi:hypothetical protein